MKYPRLIVIWISVILLSQFSVSAHDGHKKIDQDSTIVKADYEETLVTPVQEHDHEAHSHEEKSKVTADLSDFPHLHPLIVHFPIVLLVIVVAIQLANVVFQKATLDWVVTAFLLLGFIGAYLSTSFIHPHTHGLEANAALVLEEHDLWAYRTVYLTGAALLLQLLAHFKLKMRWMKIVVFLITLLAGISVSITGHYGAQLVHIEGVGPQGKYLEDEGGHSH